MATIVSRGASGVPVEEARAVDHVGFAGEQRRDEHRQLRRIELEIRVLDGDDVAARRAEAQPDGVAFPAIPLGVHDAQPRRSPRGASSTSRVPSLDPSLIDDDFAGRGEVDRQQPSMTAATVARSLKTGTMIEMSGSRGAAAVIREPPPAFRTILRQDYRRLEERTGRCEREAGCGRRRAAVSDTTAAHRFISRWRGVRPSVSSVRR